VRIIILTLTGFNFFPAQSILDSSPVFRTSSASSDDFACFCRVAIISFLPFESLAMRESFLATWYRSCRLANRLRNVSGPFPER
jgi:hypothetical protein